ncbi:hypothetical protein GTP58_28275 [Duganella sp. CY15W]|uniref:hypothetical protein n=1 Tax=Duganella sp. CY15W TaxID=2692172 RepID=UPI00136D6EE4|nr:hypothetical protein [Duganella sp. CY15W]MYM32236.1 hypothetical protein [Duganella sp. CY15W]
MKVLKIIQTLRIAFINWELRRLEAHRRRTVAEFMLAVDDGRRAAQDLYFQRGHYIANRRAELESKLRELKKELKA